MAYDNLDRSQLIEIIEELEQRLEQQEAKADQYERAAKKVKANYENYKDKQEQRRQRWEHEAKKDLATDLIGVIDNLERAIMAADQDTSLLKGVKMVADQLYEELAKRGLERINAEGEEFDPRLHNAVETTDHDEHRVVVEEKQPGYRFGDTILRPAQVVVGENNEPE
ncbi:MAG: nucleotide exchange factor GrpE [Candidatus Nanohaloarchaeota archaeon QJJ-5]|nr:nucleotide exchange factor GrpE [Candidatus Nanohaloarchaeota archaeon QJJ-5]